MKRPRLICFRPRRCRSAKDEEDSRQFRELVEHVNEFGIFMLTPDGLVATWNEGARRIYGYSAEEIIGKHTSIFYTEADQRAGLPEMVLRKALELGRWEAENLRVCKDRKPFMAQIVLCPIMDDVTGEHVGYAKVTRDITARRAAQEALAITEALLWQAQKMEAIGQITKGVAHDFNNLLTVVMGSLELLSKRVPEGDAKSRRYIDNAMTAARRGGRLTQQLISYARQQRLVPELTDVGELLPEIEPLLVASLNGQIQLRISIGADLRPCWVDPTQLQTALLNLCINCRDAMPNGGHIEMHAWNTTIGDPSRVQPTPRGDPSEIAPGEYVEISVEDDGEGMAPDVLARAFEPFFTTKDTGKGSGLGLSQVYGFARQSRGFVTLDSCRGEGTTVRLFLPVDSGQPPPDAAINPYLAERLAKPLASS